MFTARAMLGEGEELLVLGLSRENVRLLTTGHPIEISRESHGLSIMAGVKIFIFVGDTEESMREQMAGLIGPTTVVDQKKPQ